MSSSVLILFWVSKKISGSGTLSHFEGRAGFSRTPAFKAGVSSAFPPRVPRLRSVSNECRFRTCGCVDRLQGLGGPGTEEGASGLSWWPGYHWSFLGWGGGKRGNLCAAADYWGVPSRDLLPLGIYGGGSDRKEKWEDPPVGLEAGVGRSSGTHFIQVQVLSLG